MTDTVRGAGDGWAEWSRHVLMELERLNTNLERISKESRDGRDGARADIVALQQEFNKEMQSLRLEVTTLKVKAAVIAFFGALAASGLMQYLMKH